MTRKPAKPKGTRRGRPSADATPAIDRIRNAALMLFSRQGYEGTSIAGIATLAGVAKPLIHYLALLSSYRAYTSSEGDFAI